MNVFFPIRRNVKNAFHLRHLSQGQNDNQKQNKKFLKHSFFFSFLAKAFVLFTKKHIKKIDAKKNDFRNNLADAI